MKTISKYETKREEVKAKKRNAKLYPIYKMFSWDLLFFYSTQYLFLTQIKGISAGDILKFVLVLDYMKTRVGLKPEQYDKKDIELE